MAPHQFQRKLQAPAHSKSQKGFATTLITFFVLILTFSIAFSMSIIIFTRQRIQNNLVKSSQSYYTAEAGLEDAMLRLRDNYSLSPMTYNLTIKNTTAVVTIPAIIGVSRVPVSEADNAGIKRKIQAVYAIDSDAVGFNFGAQIGAGGLTTSNGSIINGNVFSNGNISGTGTISDNIIVATNGNSVSGVTIGSNAMAYSCLSSTTIQGNLTYVTGGTKDETCVVSGSVNTQSEEISPEPLPITPTMIVGWKGDAEAGGVINGDYTVGNNDTVSLGPKKIMGNLTVSNNATLNVTGTIYVTGNVSFLNNAIIKLDTSYGGLSGIFISDGLIPVINNAVFTGSGQPGSYLLVLSTSTADNALDIRNNAEGAIFYTSNGGITVYNNVTVKQLTGYKAHLNNNAVINYESGLANTFFTSGPSAGWKVTSWTEQ